ncbi:GNAT family N-acetyltransferase [Arsukibacterium sp.]|uniref:GNAT family N-acetyltransferase n=1 Tax=Arsukibacterium sp. TaxID=1977258 RepID=UPI00299F039F|nr:GNAT family N-acetyltransferase [Arsukibacterium sp.]MDX1536280.1 GNAT family N-acetyltransferase [Arsukibacterium sp.]
MMITTSHLKMVPLTASDWPLFQALHTESDVIALCFDPPTEAELQQKFQHRLTPWHNAAEHWLCLTITLRETGQAIGVTGLCLTSGVAEVGYLLLPQFYGKGFGSESLAALVDWAKTTQGIIKFKAVVTEGNVGSERVLEKVGFSLAAIVPDAHTIAGKRYADHIYQLEAF